MSGTSERVFISYAREDSAAASRFYEDLKRAGLRPWMDKKDLLPGQNWSLEIRKAIKNSRYFIALFSSTSVQKRGYIQREFKFALDVLDEFPEGEIFAIPARLDNCEIPYEKFRGLERVDLFPSWEVGIRRIMQAILPEGNKYDYQSGSVPPVKLSTQNENVNEENQFKNNLFTFIQRRFSLEEIKVLSFKLGLPDGSLPEATKDRMITEFIELSYRRTKIDNLLAVLKEERPESVGEIQRLQKMHSTKGENESRNWD